MPKGYKLNLTGQKFGRLTVIERAGKLYGTQSAWKCKCDCGNEKIIAGAHLTKKQRPTYSCGCFAIERTKECNTTHGKTKTPEFTVWVNMMDRCYNSNRKGYEYYGGRGIKVDLVWHGSEGVIRFLSDMGSRPSSAHSLDRIDVNKDYGPSNCRWGTKQEQAANRRPFKALTGFSTEELLTELYRRGAAGKPE